MMRLSSIVRARDAEVATLKATVHEACRERGEAQRALLEARQRERESAKALELAAHSQAHSGGGGASLRGTGSARKKPPSPFGSNGGRGRPQRLAPLAR